MTYTSIGDSFVKNGDRHVRNAEKWFAEGKPDYAEGSLRKATRNYKRAEELRSLFAIPAEMQAVFTLTRNAIEQNLYYGTFGGSLNGPFE